MNETKAETRFVKLIRDNGGLALKLRHRFMAGLPDLYIKMEGLEGVFIECKFEPWPIRKDHFDLNLSALQREFIYRCNKVGQPAVWALFTERPVSAKTKRLCVSFGADPSWKSVRHQDFFGRDVWDGATDFDVHNMMIDAVRTGRVGN